jgi:hypothetical protein
MGYIDRQCISTVKKLRELGLAWHQGAWQNVHGNDFVAETDAMHAKLVRRVDEREGCTEDSPEEAELEPTADVLEANEAKRWPLGKIPSGKG